MKYGNNKYYECFLNRYPLKLLKRFISAIIVVYIVHVITNYYVICRVKFFWIVIIRCDLCIVGTDIKIVF